MSFGKSRYNKNYDWELVRYCNILNHNIIGGASKLLNYFRKINNGSIISYADYTWSNGNLYQKLGFNLINQTRPSFWYINKDGIYSRNQFQKHKLKNKLTIFDEKLTEWQNMVNNGYDRIWGCGNLVYVID